MSSRAFLFFLGLFTAACSAPRWLEDTEIEPPLHLSEVGLFRDTGALEADEALTGFEPNFALWSNGADKQRLLYLPAGATIDTAKPDKWDFPAGTVLAKTFSLPGGAPIETRLIFRRRDGWDYAAYVWNAEQSDADLLEGNWLEAAMDLSDAAGEPFPYTVPARLDCRTCHETSQSRTGTPVLGLSELQLPPSLKDAAFFAGPVATREVKGRSPAETKALGYFVGNCIACHNGGSGENASFSLYPDAAVENTVGHPTETDTGVGTRVIPGDRESSVLFIGVVRARQPGYKDPFKAMPPIAITRPDPAAEAVLGEWIDELPSDGEGP